MDSIGKGVLLAAALFLLLCLYIVLRWPKKDQGSLDERRSSKDRAACHEAGHAVVAWFSPYVERVQLVTLESAGGGGVLRSRSSRHTQDMLWDDMVIRFAGIAAESEILGEFFAKEVRDDLSRAIASAKELAWQESLETSREFSPPWGEDERETLADVKDFIPDPLPPRAVSMLNHAFRHALYLMHEKRSRVEAVMHALRNRGTLDVGHLRGLLGPRPSRILCSVPPGEPPSHP